MKEILIDVNLKKNKNENKITKTNYRTDSSATLMQYYVYCRMHFKKSRCSALFRKLLLCLKYRIMKTIINYQFKVKTIECGQRRSYGDSYYTYEVESYRSEQTVKAFCMNVLKPSYEKKDMPNPFAGELLEFKKITNSNKDKAPFENDDPEIYRYSVKCMYTD